VAPTARSRPCDVALSERARTRQIRDRLRDVGPSVADHIEWRRNRRLITFLGHNPQVKVAPPLLDAAVLYVVGLGSVLTAIVFGYFAQHLFSHQDAYGANKIYFHTLGNEIRLTDEMDREETATMKMGTALQVAAVSTAVVAFVCFIFGSFEALAGLAQ
jgi:hypothetical protein